MKHIKPYIILESYEDEYSKYSNLKQQMYELERDEVFKKKLQKWKILQMNIDELSKRLEVTTSNIYLQKKVEKRNNSNNYYIYANSNWIDKNNKRITLTAFVGNFDKFPLGLQDPEAMRIGQQKINEIIKKKIESGL